MDKKKRNLLMGGIAALLVILIGCLLISLLGHPYSSEETAYIYIDEDDDADSVKTKLVEIDCGTSAFTLLNCVRAYKTRTGRYGVTNDITGFNLYRKLKNGQQDPVNVTIPSTRTLDRLVGSVTRNLMLDSTTVMNALNDSSFLSQYGYTKETIPALFIPNTYEFFWNTTLPDFMKRLQKENDSFWTSERKQKAESLKLSTTEVYTLASIVDEETANNGEKPMIAQMYLNRLKIGMPLQADPTVKYAVGDWSLRRILQGHLKTKSPYNTYINVGLCPGPIRIASIAGIDAVLNHANHDYIYMCAKEDFSGTHNFATTYAEHLKNAHKYAEALNARGIK